MSGGAIGRAVRGGIVHRRVQTLAVALVALVSTASTVLAHAQVVDSNTPGAHAFAAQRGADLVATLAPGRVTAAELAATARLPQVSALAGPFDEVTLPASNDGFPFGPITVVGRAHPDGTVDDLDLTAGRWVSGPGEVVLANGEDGIGLSVGAKLRVGSGAGAQVLTVVGIANSITGTAEAWTTPGEIAVLRAGGVPRALQMLYRFYDDAEGSALRSDVSAVDRAVPADALIGNQSYLAARSQENGSIGPFVPFMLAFGVLGIVMAALIIANVVGGAVVAGYRRIGILKSLGFTPTQVAVAYAAQVAVPALAGCALGTILGNLLALSLLQRTAEAYGVGSLGVPAWIDAAVPACACALAALAALLPAVHAGRMSTVQAIATGRAPRSGRGFAVQRLLARTPLPRALSLGLAAPFARPSRTALSLASLLLGATAVTFAVGLTTSLERVVQGLSHDAAEPVWVAMPGQRQSAASGQAAIETALASTPGTLRSVAEADLLVDVPGLSGQVSLAAFRGQADWTGYELVSGHWYTGPDQVLVGTGFLTATGTSVGDTIDLALGSHLQRVHIVGQIFISDNDGLDAITDWATLQRLDSSAVPDQFDVGLRPGVSATGYVEALSRALGPSYPVGINARKSKEIDAMIGLITTLTLLLGGVAALGVLNTVVLTTRDRVHDLGVVKAIGMSPRQTVTMAVSWVAGVGLVAGIVAVPLGIALHNEVLPQMAASVGVALPTHILDVYGTPELVLLALSGVVIAIAGALAPAGWAARTNTANALHTE